MGVMRFLALPTEAVGEWPEASSAYITALDGRVYPARVEFVDNVLSCTRATSESGKLHVPWPVEGFGRPVLTTASLPENDQPYLLALELARGKIGELRDQAFQWQFAGMAISDEFEEQLRKAFKLFSHASAIRSDSVGASQVAQQALREACAAARMLAKSYTVQRQQSRAVSSHPPALLGCTLDDSVLSHPWGNSFFNTFSAAAVPIEWRRVEPVEGAYEWEPLDKLVAACRRNRCVIRAGPLLDLAPGGLPSWLAPWAADFLNLQSFVCDFMETAVSKYAGSIRIWEVSARGNSGGGLALTEEQRLSVTARCIEAAQKSDTEAQLFVRINQPWGEYQATAGNRLTPYQFADALVRSRLGLKGVNLEIAVGYLPAGDLNRDLLSVSRLIDLWSLLGVQLHVTLAFPSSSSDDPRADSEFKVHESSPWREGWGDAAQANWADDYVGMIMAKPQVTGVFWSHFHDGHPHRFPHAGAIDSGGEAKPILDALAGRQTNRTSTAITDSDSHAMTDDGTWVEEP